MWVFLSAVRFEYLPSKGIGEYYKMYSISTVRSSTIKIHRAMIILCELGSHTYAYDVVPQSRRIISYLKLSS